MKPEEKSVKLNQFEVLEWVFNLGRRYGCPHGFQDHITKFLYLVADGGAIDFKETLAEMMRGDW